MWVRSITIGREGDWGQSSLKGTEKLLGKVKLQGDHASMEVEIDPATIDKLIEFLARDLVDIGHEAVETLTASSIAPAFYLEAPAAPPADCREMTEEEAEVYAAEDDEIPF